MANSTSNIDDINSALTPQAFFDLANFEHHAIFEQDVTYVWDALKHIKSYIAQWFTTHSAVLQGQISSGAYLVNPEQIYMGEGSVIDPGTYVAGPCIIGRNCAIRHGAYVRGNVIMGDGTIIGHPSEVKNSILLNKAQVPHFAYVGDSILGNHINLGAGTKLSNLTVVSVKDKATGKRPTIKISIAGHTYDTGLAKLGAILGDGAQTGCNSVLNPGCLVGPHTLIYPNTSLPKGYYEGHKLIKLRQPLEIVERIAQH